MSKLILRLTRDQLIFLWNELNHELGAYSPEDAQRLAAVEAALRETLPSIDTARNPEWEDGSAQEAADAFDEGKDVYDWHFADNAETPHTATYVAETGESVRQWPLDADPDGSKAKAWAEKLNKGSTPGGTTTIKLTLTMVLEHESGRDLTAQERIAARAATEQAIQNRLFGDGFLPDDVLVETWEVK